jgi:hypothetical protein
MAMFDSLIARAGRAAERRAAERARLLAAALAGALPGDIAVAEDADGVRLMGRALKRRLALDPALKWTIVGLIR